MCRSRRTSVLRGGPQWRRAYPTSKPSTGTWFTRPSSTNDQTFTSFPLGVSTDLPVTDDFNGDEKTDPAI